MNIYFFANRVYQFSYARPLFEKMGGTFVVRKYKTLLRFKKHLWYKAFFTASSSGIGSSRVIKRHILKMHDLKGVLLSQSNTPLQVDPAKCQTIFIGHGTGDKKYGGSSSDLESYKYHFISGQKHMEKLKDFNVKMSEDRLIKIGNMRFDDYINGKINRQQVIKNLGIVDTERKNILYAPTWKVGNGTFHVYSRKFCEEISKEHNLIIRPHHGDVKHLPKLKAWAKSKGLKHIYFSNPNRILYSDTMHDFAASDLMISDTSSILYEYLITGKPVIVAKTDFKILHNMPDEMNIMNITDIYDGSVNILDLVNENLFNNKRQHLYKKMLDNCFYFNDGRSVERAADFIKSIM